MKIAVFAGEDTEGLDPEENRSDEPGDQIPQELAEDNFSQNFHRMFDAFFSGNHPFFCPEGRAWNPPTDIFETEDALHIKIEVAGLRQSDIDVKINRDYLVIRGQRKDMDRQSNARFHLMEIHYGSFERVVRLPHPVEIKNIEATLQNGFLKIRVTKDGSAAEYRIEIE